MAIYKYKWSVHPHYKKTKHIFSFTSSHADHFGLICLSFKIFVSLRCLYNVCIHDIGYTYLSNNMNSCTLLCILIKQPCNKHDLCGCFVHLHVHVGEQSGKTFLNYRALSKSSLKTFIILCMYIVLTLCLN